MPNSLEERLKGKEREVLSAVREHGVRDAMGMYGVRTRSSFMVWLKSHGDGLFKANPLARMTGGEKHKWLLEHRETIFDLLEIWGTDKVMDEFCLKEETLDGLEAGGDGPYRKKLSRLDRLEINMRDVKASIKGLTEKVGQMAFRLAISDEGWNQVKRDNREIQEASADFAETTAKRVAEVLIIPLLERLMPDKRLILQGPDLSIGSLLAQGGKEQAQNDMVEATPENPLLEMVTSQLRKVYLSAHPMAQGNKAKEVTDENDK